VVTRGLSLREELELKGISYDLLPFIFPALDMHPTIVLTPCPLAQGLQPPQPPVQPPPTSPQVGSGDEAFDKVHVVEEVPSSPELIEVSSDEGGMEPDEDEEEPGEEVGEHEPLEEDVEDHESDPNGEDLEMDDADSDSRKEDDDSSNPDYDPSRDR